MKRILAVLAAVVAFLGWAGVPASASGGWAVTYLDPGPAAYAGGTSYTLGFWVLQHGTHPYAGKLDPVGLRFTRADGKSVTFDGTALPEAAHYAAAVVLPDGVWKVEGVQGWFLPYEVGTLTVPGGLRVAPVPPEMVATFGGSGADYWGAVRPPGFPVGRAAPAAVTGSPSPQGEVVASVREEAGGIPGYLLGVAALGGALVAFVALWLVRASGVSWRSWGSRPSRRSPGEGEPPGEGGAETLVIGG
ncbi:MAG: hypothetical protein HOV97_27920 [Nonomuraea sp.]|nr:hypothetical protein [Nonomuraea sp.]